MDLRDGAYILNIKCQIRYQKISLNLACLLYVLDEFARRRLCVPCVSFKHFCKADVQLFIPSKK